MKNVCKDVVINRDAISFNRFNDVVIILDNEIKIYKLDADDGVRKEMPTKELVVNRSAFIAQFANIGKGQKGIVTTLQMNNCLSCAAIRALIDSITIRVDNVDESDEYDTPNGKKHYAGVGSIVSIDAFKLNAIGANKVAKYNSRDAYDEYAKDAISCL